MDEWSHPVWVRGLKQLLYKRLPHYDGVAPRVGAWIETYRSAAIGS